MQNRLRIGLVGFGSMGRTHAYCVSALPFFYQGLPFQAVISALCTTDLKKTERLCREYGIEKACKDDIEMIGDPDIDIIDICTPNKYHYETARRAILAGKHVLCEKPLCTDPEQAQELADLAQKSGLVCGMVFNNRHLPAVIRAHELITEGKLGRILSFSFSYLHNSDLDPNKPSGWKQDLAVSGGGTLYDLGPHVIDLCHWLVGDLSSISAYAQIAFQSHPDAYGRQVPTNANEAFYMLARTAGGACGTIVCSKIENGTDDDLHFRVNGTGGSLSFSLMEPDYLDYYCADVPNRPHGGISGVTRISCGGRYDAPGGSFPSPKAPIGWLRGHVHSYYAYLNSVFSKNAFSPSFSDGAYVQKILSAANKAAETGKDVTV